MIRIYGASDDLIEIDGLISEEIGCYDNTNQSIECSDGTRGKISYDGNWHISISKQGDSFLKIVNGNPSEDEHVDPDVKDCTSYSDVLCLASHLDWIKIGRKKFRPTGDDANS